MKQVPLPLYDPTGDLTPVLVEYADKFTSTNDPADPANKIILTFENDQDADDFLKDLPADAVKADDATDPHA